jgi:starch phosphorylase
MKHVLTLNVKPSIPEALVPLEALAYNLFWCWDHEAIDLFRRLDEEVWEKSFHNPVMMLSRIPQERLESLLNDESFVEHMNRVCERTGRYLSSESTWFRKFHKGDLPLVAYFSAEWGLTECMRIYSGGLGILAGDFIKSSSDLGLPMVGVGILYQEGYFHQYLNVDGWQQERTDANDFFSLPIKATTDAAGNPIMIALDLGRRRVLVRCWTAQVGRLPLYLLDTNIPENDPEDRKITARLYDGSHDMRIRQEIVLGIGGTRMLSAIGVDPAVYHMNDGHPAFLVLERIRQIMISKGLSFDEAREVSRAGSIFTTHTPVPAGIDEFDSRTVEAHLGVFASELGVGINQVLGLGRHNPQNPDEPFNMARLAIRESAYINGVSRLHGEVSRKMWWGMWGQVSFEEIPIGHVTNGIHIPSWVSHDMASLLDRYIGRAWVERPTDPTVWEGVWKIPDSELWRTHERRRERLVAFARTCLSRQMRDKGAGWEATRAAEEVLDPSALTIGFARRFATYKRAVLLLRDEERLKRILRNADRPVQIIFAGKAHPHDGEGKEFIRRIIHFVGQDDVRNRVVFIEDYNTIVSRYLVEGVDVWLNTPLRPMEACGTSGMKVVPNGGLNISILDGWWDEAYTPDVGWAIGKGEEYSDREYQDHVESNTLYNLLEREVAPLFYERGRDGLPRGWIRMMKKSMHMLCPVYNTDMMVKNYVNNFYLPAMADAQALADDDFGKARALAAWVRRLRDTWDTLEIISVRADIAGNERVGAKVPIEAIIRLGRLAPEDVSVEIYYSQLDEDGCSRRGRAIEMQVSEKRDDGAWSYRAVVPCNESGQHGLSVRVIPSRMRVSNPIKLGLVKWM